MVVDSATRSEVAQRAGGCCEYCLLPEPYTTLPFQLDHVIATKHDGPSDATNLAYACLHGNSFKGPNLAGRDHEQHRTVRMYHPREDDWDDHFEWDGPVLMPRTLIGRVTIAVLRVNLPDRVAVRAALMDEGIFPPVREGSG